MLSRRGLNKSDERSPSLIKSIDWKELHKEEVPENKFKLERHLLNTFPLWCNVEL